MSGNDAGPGPAGPLPEVPEPGQEPEADRGVIQSIDRAGQILALFDQDTLRLSAATVSERLGLNRTTAHRYLVSLQSAGFLNKSNSPGPILDQLAAFISGRRQVLSLAPPLMRKLSDETGITVVMSILGRSGPVVALVEETAIGTIVITVRVGTVLAPKSAQARVLMAFQPEPSAVTRYLAALPDGEAHAERAELDRTRREGVSWSRLGHLGLAAVAAPVFRGRDVQAAIALISTGKMLAASDDAEAAGPGLADRGLATTGPAGPSPMAQKLRDTAAQLSALVSA